MKHLKSLTPSSAHLTIVVLGIGVGVGIAAGSSLLDTELAMLTTWWVTATASLVIGVGFSVERKRHLLAVTVLTGVSLVTLIFLARFDFAAFIYWGLTVAAMWFTLPIYTLGRWLIDRRKASGK